jgi:hypothetical protein
MIFLITPHPWEFLRHHPRVRTFPDLASAISAIMAALKEGSVRKMGDRAKIIAEASVAPRSWNAGTLHGCTTGHRPSAPR